ncbi:MAG: S-layer protein, partial [Synergistaceae bacterium]|nr:S-layer protein [Synergistaceae bacterium]
ASQQWNDKWDSWLRYSWADYDNGGEEFNQIGAGIGYQLNPAVHFELAYDYAEYNNGSDDNLIRFQTVVNF